MTDRHVVIQWLNWGRCPEVASVSGPYDTKEAADAAADRIRSWLPQGQSVSVEALEGPK